MTVMPQTPATSKRERRAGGEREADGERADAARRHGEHGQRGAAPSIGGPAADPAPERADGDDQEGGGAGIEPGVGACRRAPRRLAARKTADPRPHRVQLPHVAEIAEAGQAQRRDRGTPRPPCARRSAPRGTRCGPSLTKAQTTDAAGDRQERGGQQDVPRQGRSVRPRIRCGAAEPTVRAPTRMPRPGRGPRETTSP